MKVNTSILNLSNSYLFREIAAKVDAFQVKNPKMEIIKMGIGDVTLPLPKSIVVAMKNAVKEMGNQSTFKGYGNEQGYEFLRESIKKSYAKRNVKLDINEIFVSDGAKTDLGNLLDLFSSGNKALIFDPVYPAYVEANIIHGNKILFLNTCKEDGFVALPTKNLKADLIYICSPNNPTGVVYWKDVLQQWVNFANKNGSVILFDAAYEAYIQDNACVHSIFEIPGAENCAIEICSFSKNAGFTGVRCGHTIIPTALKRKGESLNKMFLRRQSCKFNGVSYITQVGANAVFLPEAQSEISQNVKYYQNNAKIIGDALTKLSIFHTGEENSPYIWAQTPNGFSSWEFFDFLLENCGIVSTPGVGFGKCGEGFVRFSAFSSLQNTQKCAYRLLNKFQQ